MKEYTIQLTDAQDLALSHVAVSQQDWINNAIENRCRTAMEEIVTEVVEKCLAQNIPVPGSKDDIVALAFEKGWIKTAQQMHKESQSAMVSNQ